MLERVRLDPVAAVERFGGLQAQEPASPYIALWTRLVDFDATDLDRDFHDRRIVKTSLMRATLHAVSADDYRHLLPAIQPMLQGIRRQDRREPPDAARMAALATAAETFTAEPRMLTEVRAHLAAADADWIERVGGGDGSHRAIEPDELIWWLWRNAPFLRAPSAAPWTFDRRTRIVSAAAWLDEGFAESHAALERLVCRHLGAFGPASVADLANWSGLAMGFLRPAVEALETRGLLRRFADERGRVLFDVTDGPLPPGDRSAPPRLLPMWDSVLLAFADRSRVIDDADRPIVTARNGDTLPTFLVDGRVAGLWWADAEPGGRTRIVLEPFGALAGRDRMALEDEAERLAEFVEPREPGVYGRYRGTRARRSREA